MKINEIRKPKGATKSPKRVGRGSGTGHGKTSSRGMKGAKSRAGYSRRLGFEGGQMPLMRRIPKRGFTSAKKKIYQVVNVEQLSHFKKDSIVDPEALKKAGLIRRGNDKVKILGGGKFGKAISVKAHGFSKEAKKKIEESGGTVTHV